VKNETAHDLQKGGNQGTKKDNWGGGGDSGLGKRAPSGWEVKKGGATMYLGKSEGNMPRCEKK